MVVCIWPPSVALAVAVNGQVAGTYMPNAILAKSGGSKAQWGGVSPTRRARESSDFYEGKIMRDTPCATRGAEPLAFCSWRWGVAGRVDLPAEVGGGGPSGRRQGGNLPPVR